MIVCIAGFIGKIWSFLEAVLPENLDWRGMFQA